MAHTNRRLVEHAALEHGVRLRIKVEADSVAFAKALVERGLGYTILTYAAVQDEVLRKRLTVYPIVRPTLTTPVAIVTLARAASQADFGRERDAARHLPVTGARQGLGRRAASLSDSVNSPTRRKAHSSAANHAEIVLLESGAAHCGARTCDLSFHHAR